MCVMLAFVVYLAETMLFRTRSTLITMLNGWHEYLRVLIEMAMMFTHKMSLNNYRSILFRSPINWMRSWRTFLSVRIPTLLEGSLDRIERQLFKGIYLRAVNGASISSYSDTERSGGTITIT